MLFQHFYTLISDCLTFRFSC